MTHTISPGDRISRRHGMLTATLGTGIAILDVPGDRYLSLNESAAVAWELLDEPRTVDEMVTALRAEFEVDEAICREQVTSLFQNWLKDDLIDIEND